VDLNYAIERKADRVMVSRTQEQGFEHAMDEARKQASHVAHTAQTAARETASSFETAARRLVEEQPYTAVGIALGVGWLLGRMHRPL
jgi:ElaB/YqjD/DUF883 family membrane-anchored ribosome-binding protein